MWGKKNKCVIAKTNRSSQQNQVAAVMNYIDEGNWLAGATNTAIMSDKQKLAVFTSGCDQSHFACALPVFSPLAARSV